ncbi:MAG: PAS domain S-box protein [Deltaproteobacteria bacterium]|nr:PAS domain S-box protein [Deltaproteobacteria bacterium]
MARILVVEDADFVASYIAESLKRRGHTVSSIVTSGEEAVKKAGDEGADLVIMDIFLEGQMDGVEAAEKIRKSYNIPVVFLTGHGGEELLERVKATDPYGYLHKPFKDEDLHVAVEIALYKARVHEKLRENEKQYRNLVESINDVIYSVDEEGRITYMSPSVERLGGYSADEMIGHPFSDFVHPDDIQALKERFVLIGKAVEMPPVEYRIIDKSGSVRWVRTHGRPVFEGKRFVGVRGALTDITERREAEEALQAVRDELERRVEERTSHLAALNRQLEEEVEERKQKEDQLRLLSRAVEQSSEGIAISDLEGKIQYVNPSFAKTHGYRPEELLGRSLSILHGPDQVQAFDAANRQVRETGKFFGEVHHSRRNGSSFPALVHKSLLRDEAGNEIGMITTLRDATLRKKMEQEMTRSEKLASLGFLISGIAHEINNPINFITFNIPVLKDYLMELMPIVDRYAEGRKDFEIFGMSYPEFREDVFRLLENIRHGSDRINKTVAGLKEFISHGDRRDLRVVELQEVIRKGVAICRTKIERMVKRLEVRLPPGSFRVTTDPEALEQVLVNLLINAAQASDKEASWVRLELKVKDAPKKELAIEVSDNGCGMDEEIQGKIFDPFFTTKSPGEGTGLGLAVCHRVVQNLGGRIEVESKKGEGSLFKVVLPIVE